MLFWRSRKKGIIQTRRVTLDDIRFIFFPKDENEKYEYLGYIYVSKYNQKGELSRYYKAIMPLVWAMDEKAKPKWCPRWFLRFLEVFGNDRSIVRVRNFTLHNLQRKLLKGYRFIDWKTKWEWYDLRISINACKELNDMADQIERDFYEQGRAEDMKDYPENYDIENEK